MYTECSTSRKFIYFYQAYLFESHNKATYTTQKPKLYIHAKDTEIFFAAKTRKQSELICS